MFLVLVLLFLVFYYPSSSSSQYCHCHYYVYYRQHDEQEMSLHASDPIWGFRYILIGIERLRDPMNPMDKWNTARHLSSLERKAARTILSTIHRHGLKKADELRNEVNWTWSQVATRSFS